MADEYACGVIADFDYHDASGPGDWDRYSPNALAAINLAGKRSAEHLGLFIQD